MQETKGRHDGFLSRLPLVRFGAGTFGATSGQERRISFHWSGVSWSSSHIRDPGLDLLRKDCTRMHREVFSVQQHIPASGKLHVLPSRSLAVL